MFCMQFIGYDIDQLSRDGMDWIIREISGLTHFPIIIDIINNNEVLPKYIASCSFFGVKPILS